MKNNKCDRRFDCDDYKYDHCEGCGENKPQGDLISREALKDIAYINKGNFNTVEGIRKWIDNAPTVTPKLPTEVKKALEVLKAMKQGRWIPVSEKLPPNYIICLFCDIDGDIYYGHRTYENNWYAANIDDNIPGVVAWQELPEPYKEGGAK